MKKLSIVLLIVLFCIPSIFAARLKVKLEAPDHVPGQNYAFGYTEYEWQLAPWREMNEMLLSEDGVFELELPTGCYDIVMLHPTANKISYNIFVPDTDEELELNVQMDRLSIAKEIKYIAAMGSFNNHSFTEKDHLVYNSGNNTYTLPDSLMNTPIDEIFFMVNGEKAVHIPSLPTTKYNVWANLSNIITDGNSSIVFNPNDYRRGEAEYVISGSAADSTYYMIHNKLRDMAISLNQTIYTGVTTSNNLDSIISLRNSFYNDLLTLKNQVPEKYRWLFLENEFMLAQNYHPVYLEIIYYSTNVNRQKLEEIRKSPGYYNYYSDIIITAKKLIEESPWLPYYLYSSFSNLDVQVINYSMYNDVNIPAGYFNNFLNKVLETSKNDQVCGSILFNRAHNMEFMFENRAIELIEIIKTKYPKYAGLHDGTIEMLMKRFKFKEGTTAPDFSIETLSGETFKLSENKGKFVLIDFWGTWCSPCVGEVPHLIKLAETIPTDQLIIIGLSVNDTENVLKNFIADKKINYEVAMCSEEIQQKFGINSFPTSFLLDKEGKIVAKDLRGDIIDYVKSLME